VAAKFGRIYLDKKVKQCVVNSYTFDDCFRLSEWLNSSKLLMPTLFNFLLTEYPKVKG